MPAAVHARTSPDRSAPPSSDPPSRGSCCSGTADGSRADRCRGGRRGPRTATADAERLWIRPRDVPELTHDGIGSRRLHEPRQQRVVIVLHEHDRAGTGNLLEHHVGKAAVDGHILPPVALVEHRPRVGDVTQRPQRIVRDAVVVAVLLLRLQPHAAQRVLRLVRRNREASRRIRRLEIAAPVAMRDPRAAARLHHRIERRHQSARRLLPVDAHLVALTQHPASQPAAHGHMFLVHVGLPIRHHHELGVAKPVGHRPHEVSRRHRRYPFPCPLLFTPRRTAATSAGEFSRRRASEGRCPTTTVNPSRTARKASSSVTSSPKKTHHAVPTRVHLDVVDDPAHGVAFVPGMLGNNSIASLASSDLQRARVEPRDERVNAERSTPLRRVVRRPARAR